MKDGAEVVGTFTFKEKDIEEGEFAKVSPWLACIVVKKEFRGKGYGRKILEHIDSIARENYPQLYLFTEHVGYYEKIGFKFVKEIVHHGQINRVYKKE